MRREVTRRKAVRTIRQSRSTSRARTLPVRSAWRRITSRSQASSAGATPAAAMAVSALRRRSRVPSTSIT